MQASRRTFFKSAMSLGIAGSAYASLAGCSRQTVNRRLGGLKREGLIEVKRGTIRVLDRERLQAEAEA